MMMNNKNSNEAFEKIFQYETETQIFYTKLIKLIWVSKEKWNDNFDYEIDWCIGWRWFNWWHEKSCEQKNLDTQMKKKSRIW